MKPDEIGRRYKALHAEKQKQIDLEKRQRKSREEQPAAVERENRLALNEVVVPYLREVRSQLGDAFDFDTRKRKFNARYYRRIIRTQGLWSSFNRYLGR
jgi:hypothetical protein